MDLIYGNGYGLRSRAHGSEAWEEGRPAKKLRTSRSHASILQPIFRIARDPFETIGTIAERLGYGQTIERDPKELSEEQRERYLHLLRLRGAKTYVEWKTAATELDRIDRSNDWKAEDESDEYDVKLVQRRLQELEEACAEDDADRMLFLVRTSLTRNLGGIGDLRLYKHSRVGTKKLIERYIETVLHTIEKVAHHAGYGGGSKLEAKDILRPFVCTRQSFGRSALLLSGGGTLGMNHIGVCKSLLEANLLPRIISGSSAGSIVCSVLCSRTDSEIPGVLNEFCYGDLAVFERRGEPESVLAKVARFLKVGALFDISHLVRVMRNLLGDMTFQEAYNRTRRILNITVSSASLYELPRLLNYVTAPNVMIWSAVAASCSVPFIFSAAQLLAKDPKTHKEVPWNPSPQKWIDGSVDNDLPMTRLAEMFNVNHFIVSQVNPHVVPFLAKEEHDITAEAQRSTSSVPVGPSWMHAVANLGKGEALHRMHVLSELGIFSNTMTKVRSVLGQRYAGDITIMPEISYTHFPSVLANPTTEFMLQAMSNGERATWPKLSRIRNHLAIELALDDAIADIRTKVAFSPSQVDLRINAFSREASSTRSERGRGRHSMTVNHHTITAVSGLGEKPGRQGKHKAAKSLLDSPSIVPNLPSMKVAGPSPTGDASSEDEARSRSTSRTAVYGNDETEDVLSDSTLDSSSSRRPRLWPSTRQLFPSASQPVTPNSASRTFPYSPAASEIATPDPASLTSAANIKRPSSPELKFKSLFRDLAPMSTIYSQTTTPEPHEPPTSPRKSRKLGLHLDISGTRGLVRRRKRSLSTGLKGLFPPGPQ